MSAENRNDESANELTNQYETPAIEEVVTREGLEREVAYAGIIAPSLTPN